MDGNIDTHSRRLSRAAASLFEALILIVCTFSAAAQTGPEFHDFRRHEIHQLNRLRTPDPSGDSAVLQNQRMFDVLWYDIGITVVPDSQIIYGTVTLSAAANSDSLRSLCLNLDNALTVTAVAGADSFLHADDIVTLFPDSAYLRAETVTLAVSYSGTPDAGGFGSFVWETQDDGNQLISTLSEPDYARTWWPCKDLPEDKPDSVTIRITVPETMTAVSNGSLESVADSGAGWKTFVWKERYPIAAYLVSLAISDYEITREYFVYSAADSMPVEYYVTPLNYGPAWAEESGLHETVKMLDVFSGLFGLYPFANEKYAQAEFSWSGGMEHQTATSLGIRGRSPNVYLVSHELAHQWWGDLVTCREWEHLWLNEGFATYSEGLYLEAMYGPDTLRDYMTAIDRYTYTGTVYPDRVYRDNTDDVRALFNATVYDKGAWVLHMLRSVVGDSAFFRTLRSYAHEPGLRFGAAVTEDFQAVAEQECGAPLDRFFHQWIYEYGRPEYALEWSAEPAEDSVRVSVTIGQVQYPSNPAVFTMPVELEFAYGSGPADTIRVMNSEDMQHYEFVLRDQPSFVRLDPGNRILKIVRSVLAVENRATRPVEFRLLQNYPNPFNAETVISFMAPVGKPAQVDVFNVAGRMIRRLHASGQASELRRVMWDGKDSAGIAAGSGVYFFRVTCGGQSAVRKMLLLR